MQQRSNFNKFSNSWQVTKSIYQNEGPKQFYRSFPAQLPLTVLSIGSYYYFYNDLLRRPFNKQQTENPMMSFSARCIISSIIATTLTHPFDIVVTRVNTQFTDGCHSTSTESKTATTTNNVSKSLKSSTKDPYLNLSNTNHLFKSSTRLGSNQAVNNPSKQITQNVNLNNETTKQQKISIRQLSSNSPPKFDSINTNNSKNVRIVTFLSASKDLYNQSKSRGFRQVIFKENAYMTRLFMSVPSTFITWGVYEMIKKYSI